VTAAYHDALREAVAHLATHDPTCARFGARHHRYRWGAPLGAARVAAIEAELGHALPDDYRAFVELVGDGGAGPAYGLMPLDHPVQRAIGRGEPPPLRPGLPDDDIPVGRALYRGVVGLAHLGCGYVALLPLAGPARGQVWLDARGSGDGLVAMYPSFHAMLNDWIGALATARWPRGWITPGRCALPSALTAYLGAVEQRLGVAPGALDGAALAEALGDIPDGGIQIAETGDTPFFDAGDLVDPCVVCEQTIENLVPRGLRRAQLVPGVAPRPLRDISP
jgi:hypothetical protein